MCLLHVETAVGGILGTRKSLHPLGLGNLQPSRVGWARVMRDDQVMVFVPAPLPIALTNAINWRNGSFGAGS